MKLWTLEPIDSWNDCDCNESVLVRAETEDQARQCAEEERQAEPKGSWLDATQTLCDELTGDGLPGIIMRQITSY